MIITWIIFLIYNAFLYINLKKAILAAFPISLMFTTLPLIVKGSGVIYLNISLLYSCFFHLLLRGGIKWGLSKGCPYIIPLKICILSLFSVVLFGAYDSGMALVGSNLCCYLFPIVLWRFLKSKKDVSDIIRYFNIVFIVIVGYGIIEFVLQKNIWMELLQQFTTFRLYVDHLNDIRFGFGRCGSFFHFPIPFGDVCAIYFSFMLFFFCRKSALVSHRLVIFILVFMCVGVVLSNSRAALMAFLIGTLHYRLRFKFKHLVILVVSLFFLLFFLGDYISATFDSIFGNNNSGTVGSSMDMRDVQLTISLLEFGMHPFFGGGLARIADVQEIYIGAAGMESHLFVIMIGEGLVGVLSYLFTWFYMYYKFPKGKRIFPLVLSTAWVLAAMVSLTTGVTIIYPMILLMIVYRAYQLKLV